MGVIHIPRDGQMFEVIVDDDDIEWVSKTKWHIHGATKTYPKVFRNKKINDKWTTTRLHREIWEYHHGTIPNEKVVDHKNRNTLDNRKDNLRLANNSQVPLIGGVLANHSIREFTNTRMGFGGVLIFVFTGKINILDFLI